MDEAIHHSVGRHGRNHQHDVLVVQMLLNNHISAIGTRPRLNVDGVCGPVTIGAITAYQQREMHLTHSDGVIYPSSRTIRTLLAVATVKHRYLVQQVHQIQKVQSSALGPVANVTQVTPLSKTVAKALETPEAHTASTRQTGHK